MRGLEQVTAGASTGWSVALAGDAARPSAPPDFVARTPPSRHDPVRWRELLASGGGAVSPPAR